MENKNLAKACEGCMHWDNFGNKCWYFWELKKECSMHSDKS